MRRTLAAFVLATSAVASGQIASRSTYTGDLNADRSIDTHDLRIMLELLIGEHRPALERIRADLNRDGRIDDVDLTLLVEVLDGRGSGSFNCEPVNCCRFIFPIGCCGTPGVCNAPGEGGGDSGGGDPGDIGGGDPGDIGGGGGGDPPGGNEPGDPPDNSNDPCNYILCVRDAKQQFVPASAFLEAIDGVTIYAVRDPESANPTLVDVEWYLQNQTGQTISDPAAASASSYTLTPDGPGVYQLGTRCDDPEKDRGVMDIAIYDIHVKSVTFGGGNHIINPDNPDDPEPYNEPYANHHWYDANADGDTGDDIDDPGANHGFVKERGLPVAYTRSTPMTIQSFLPWVDAGEAPTGGPNPGPLTLTYRAIHDRDGDNETVFIGQYPATPAVADRNLPDHIDYEPAYHLEWEVSFNDGDTWFPIGNTTHEVYITLNDPLVDPISTPLHHTIIDIACRLGGGLNDASSLLFDGIYFEFADREVFRKYSTIPLTYYDSWSTENVMPSALLRFGDGQCGSWATLMLNCLLSQGVRENNSFTVAWSITSNTNFGFLVPVWHFVAPGTSLLQDYPYLTIPSGFWMPAPNHYPVAYAEFYDAPGLSGQGVMLPFAGNPASVFNNHQVCTVNGRVFDPSYGTAYFTLADWEDSLAGHWVKGLLEINESFYNCDVNNDGDSDDIVPAVPVYLARPNQPGYELDAPVRYTW